MASTAATVTAEAACKALAVWENGDATRNVADNASLRETFKDTTQPLSGDFAAWTSDIRSASSGVNSDADKVILDRVLDGVTIFPAASPSASAAAPSPPASPAPETVTFEVTGSYAQVTYGPAGSNISGAVPMKVTHKLGSPIYYALTAQLQGGGTVTCKIEVDGKVVSQATASGGYNIAQCEISQDPINGGWEDTNGG